MTNEERLDWLCRLRSGLVWFDIPPKERLMFEQALYEEINILQQQKTEHCKDCKYFHQYHEIERIPHILAHNICYRWGDKCFTKEDGYCYLFEQRSESEDKESGEVKWINGEMTTIDPQIKRDFREKLDERSKNEI